MSRSRRKTPIIGIAGDSDKEGKQRANRAFRRLTKIKVNKEVEVLPKLREVSQVASMPKDGKTLVRDKKDMRK